MPKVNIRVISTDGSAMNIGLNNQMKISDLRSQIIRRLGRDQFALIYDGEILKDDQMLSSLPRLDQSFITLHEKREKIPRHTHNRAEWPSFRAYAGDDEAEMLPRRIMTFQHNLPQHTDLPFINMGRIFQQNLDEHHQIEPDPPDFQQLTDSLVEMGFNRDLSQQALRISHYSPDAAIALLVSSNLPLLTVTPQNAHENRANEAVTPNEEVSATIENESRSGTDTTAEEEDSAQIEDDFDNEEEENNFISENSYSNEEEESGNEQFHERGYIDDGDGGIHYIFRGFSEGSDDGSTNSDMSNEGT